MGLSSSISLLLFQVWETKGVNKGLSVRLGSTYFAESIVNKSKS